jgi:hypothetical protein
MSTAEILTTLCALIGAFASVLAALEQNLIKKLKDNDATSPGSAVELQKLLPLSRWRLSRLKQAGAIKEVKSGRLYFNESAFKPLLKKRVLIFIILIIISGVVITFFHI